MLWLALLVASVVPRPDAVLREAIDCVDRNHFYDSEGRLVFIQQIFIDIDKHGDEQIVAWRLEKQLDQAIQRDFERGGYVVYWQDGENIREVFCRTMRETWLQYDKEIESRTILPAEKRRELRGARGIR